MTRLFRPTASNRLTLPVLMLVLSLAPTHNASVAPFINEMSADLGVSVAVMGQLGTAQFLGAFLAAVSLVSFIGGLPLRAILFLACATLCVASIVTGLASSFPVLLAVRVIAGLTSGIIAAGGFASAGRAWHDPAMRTRRSGFLVGALAGGTGLLAPAIRLVGQAADWHAALFAYGAYAGVIALLVLLALPKLPGSADAASISLRQRLSEGLRAATLPVVRTVMLIRVLVWSTMISLYAYVAAFFVAVYPGQSAWIGPLFAASSLGFAVASFASGYVFTKLGGAARVTRANGLVFPLLLAAFFWLTLSPALTLLLFLLLGLSIGTFISGIISLHYAHSGRYHSAVIFADGAVQQASAIAGAALGGLAISLAGGFAGWQVLLTLAAVATLAPLGLLARTVHPTPAAPQSHPKRPPSDRPGALD